MIIATCEKGAVEDLDSMREIKAGLDAIKEANPNLIDVAAREVWQTPSPACVADPFPRASWRKSAQERIALIQNRPKLRIGIPRVLNMYAYAPLFSAYLQSLGVASENIVYSDFTTNEMYRAGSSRGSIDPCFPSKITIAHFQQFDLRQARSPAAAMHLSPHVRCVVLTAGENSRLERLSDRRRDARDRGGGLHQGDRRLRPAQHPLPAPAGEPL